MSNDAERRDIPHSTFNIEHSTFRFYNEAMRKIVIAALLAFLTLSAAADTVVIAVRHAEKVVNGSKDPSLTPEGEKRAELLARMLRDAGVSAIYSTPFQRTRNTAAPLAKRLGIAVTVDNAEPPALAK